MWIEWLRDGVVMSGYPQWVPGQARQFQLHDPKLRCRPRDQIRRFSYTWLLIRPTSRARTRSSPAIRHRLRHRHRRHNACRAERSHLFSTANGVLNDKGYRQAHLHDYRPGVTLSAGNFTKIHLNVDNAFAPNAGIAFDLVHNNVGTDVLNWTTTSASGVVTSGTYGPVAADFLTSGRPNRLHLACVCELQLNRPLRHRGRSE